MKLSPAATIVLARAAERPDRLLEFHPKLPAAARHKMVDAMLCDGIILETKGDHRLGDGALLVEDTSTGLMLTTLALTDAGFHALDLVPPGGTGGAPTMEASTAPLVATDSTTAQEVVAVASAPDAAPAAATDTPPLKTTLRDAAEAVLDAWGDEESRTADIAGALEAPMASLRTLLAGRTSRTPASGPRKPREGTKQEAVLALLRRDEGVTVAQVIEATGWASHTVRGFFAGLKKKGIAVAAKERVRAVKSGTAGGKGAYTVYGITAPVV